MVDFSASYAGNHGLPLGLTGGVSYNGAITEMFRDAAGEKEVVLHSRVPNGDNGISAGQNLILSAKRSGSA